MLTKEEKELIQGSWKKLWKVDAVLIGDVFYTKLFKDTPALRRLFSTSLPEQSEKLVMMLHIVVGRIGNEASYIKELRHLGARHRSYGVKPEDYTSVADALLWTLQRAFTNDWTSELEAAWTKYIESLSAEMLKG